MPRERALRGDWGAGTGKSWGDWRLGGIASKGSGSLRRVGEEAWRQGGPQGHSLL